MIQTKVESTFRYIKGERVEIHYFRGTVPSILYLPSQRRVPTHHKAVSGKCNRAHRSRIQRRKHRRAKQNKN